MDPFYLGYLVDFKKNFHDLVLKSTFLNSIIKTIKGDYIKINIFLSKFFLFSILKKKDLLNNKLN